MATLTSEEVGKLVGEIRDLRNALDETSVDRAEIGKRYDAATSGLFDTQGEFIPTAWTQLSPADQAMRAAGLARLKQLLTNALAAVPPDVPIAPDSVMYKQYASNSLIAALALFALVGLVGDLWVIHNRWNIATSGKTFEDLSLKDKLSSRTPAVSASTSVTPATRAVSPRTRLPETATPPATPPAIISPTPTAGALTSPEENFAPSASATGTPTASPTVSPPPGKELTGTPAPTEDSVLLMVILLGALGGFLHLASSMANYVGNRQLLRSWVVYYFLIPFQGAALAPIVYLLLRVGVLNPANSQPGSASPTASLNLIGIYAFAALTGLFSKQAIETLADVFSTIFKKVNAKDSLDKPKPDAKKEG